MKLFPCLSLKHTENWSTPRVFLLICGALKPNSTSLFSFCLRGQKAGLSARTREGWTSPNVAEMQCDRKPCAALCNPAVRTQSKDSRNSAITFPSAAAV